MQTERIRVIVNDRCLRNPRTGVGHYVAELLDRVPQADPGIELLPFYRTYLSRKYPQTSEAALPSAQPGSGRVPLADRRSPWWLRRTVLGVYREAFRVVGRIKRCQLYHEPNHIPVPWSGPTVTTVHDLSVLRHPEWHPVDRVRWYEKDFMKALPRSDHFITVSNFSKQEMVDLLGLAEDRITVIPLGVRSIFHPRPAEVVCEWLRSRDLPQEYLLYAGTIEPRKNVSGLFAAYSRLPEVLRRRVPLLIAGGSGWGDESLVRLAERHRIAGDVRALGYVDEYTLAHLYCGACALVWPTFYEGFGLPPLEAMASGTPVITSHVSSLPEVTRDAAVLIDPHDEDELLHEMCRVLEDHDWAEALGIEGLVQSERFCWSRCAVEHAGLFRQMISGKAC